MRVQYEKMSSSERLNELVTPQNETIAKGVLKKQIIVPPS